MSKSFLITLLVLTLLTSPIITNAGFFGSSFDGCKDPGDDIAGYILEKSGDSTLTRSNVEQALKFIPTDVKNVTYGDIFGWLRVTENTAECFAQNDYEKGLEIIGMHAGKFAASKALGVAVVQLVGGVGGTAVFLPVTIFKWGIDYLIEGIKNTAISNQLVLYIAAVESCEESHGSRTECQQMIIDDSKYDMSATASFYENGFLMAVDTPKNPKFTDVTALNSIDPSFFKEGSADQIGITPQEFYTGATVIYDALVAKYSGSLNVARNAALRGVVAEAKKVTGENSNTKTQNNQSVGFFSGLWQTVTNSVKAAYTGITELIVGTQSKNLPTEQTGNKADIVIPNDLSDQISNALSGDVNEAVPNLSQESNTPSQIQEEQRKAEEQRTKTATPVQPSNSSDQPKPQPIQQSSPTTTQIKITILRYKTGCDRNWGTPIPFVSLDWDMNYENLTSHTIYRDNKILMSFQPSTGPSYFDGTVKAGGVYNYVIKVEYGNGYSNSAEVNVTVPTDICGSINSIQNEITAPPQVSQPSQAPSTPTPSITPPPQEIPSSTPLPPTATQTNIPPTKKTIIATVVDQNGKSFDYLIFACEKLDGSNCTLQGYSSGLMALGPYPSGEYRITIQAGAKGGEKSDAVVRSVLVDETASGTSINLGTIVLKRWGRIFVSPIDEAGDPLKAYWELEGVFDNDLCGISPISLIGGLNRDYFCSNGKTFYNYSFSNRALSLDLEKYSLPDGQYVLRAFDSLFSSTGLLYKTTVRILQGQDVNLGRIEIK